MAIILLSRTTVLIYLFLLLALYRTKHFLSLVVFGRRGFLLEGFFGRRWAFAKGGFWRGVLAGGGGGFVLDPLLI